MKNQNGSGIACLVIAALLAGVALKSTLFSPDIPVGDPSGLGVSRMVGAFLPAVVVIAIGLWLIQKPKPGK